MATATLERPLVEEQVIYFDDEVVSVEDRVVETKTFWRFSVASTLLLLALGVCLAAIVFGSLATKILVPLFVLAAVNGYRVGAMRVVAVIAALLLAGLAAGHAGQAVEGVFATLFGTTGLTNRMIAVGAVGLATLLGNAVGFLWIASRIRQRHASWDKADRAAGVVVGALQGGLILCLLTWGVLCLDSAAKARIAADRQAYGGRVADDVSATSVIALADSIRGSMFGDIATQYNPLGELKVFSLPSKFLTVIGNRAALDTFVEHPAVQAIKERPAVVAAMDRLRQDPAVQELIAADANAGNIDMVKILNSPATLEILDESELMAELAPITADLELALNEAVAVAEANPNPEVLNPVFAGNAVSIQLHPPISEAELIRLQNRD